MEKDDEGRIFHVCPLCLQRRDPRFNMNRAFHDDREDVYPPFSSYFENDSNTSSHTSEPSSEQPTTKETTSDENSDFDQHESSSFSSVSGNMEDFPDYDIEQIGRGQPSPLYLDEFGRRSDGFQGRPFRPTWFSEMDSSKYAFDAQKGRMVCYGENRSFLSNGHIDSIMNS